MCAIMYRNKKTSDLIFNTYTNDDCVYIDGNICIVQVEMVLNAHI